jgi:hypothetical protein
VRRPATQLTPVAAEYHLHIAPGYTVQALKIAPDGWYAATVRRADAWFGTTVADIPPGEGLEGVRLESVLL